jgi:hypothetical protein
VCHTSLFTVNTNAVEAARASQPEVNHPSRRRSSHRTTTHPAPDSGKMITRYRGVRTTSYSTRPYTPKKQKRVIHKNKTTARTVYKFRGVVLLPRGKRPATNSNSKSKAKSKAKSQSHQDDVPDETSETGPAVRDNSDVDAPYEEDEDGEAQGEAQGSGVVFRRMSMRGKMENGRGHLTFHELENEFGSSEMVIDPLLLSPSGSSGESDLVFFQLWVPLTCYYHSTTMNGR